MKILYIHQYFATRRGKSGIRSLEQALAMQRAGHDVTMLTTDCLLLPDEIPAGDGLVRRGIVAGVPAIVLAIPYDQTMSYPRRILSFLQFVWWSSLVVLTERRPDLIFATSTPLTIGVPALVGRLLRRVPYIFEVRDLWPDVPYALGAVPSKLVYRLLQGFERLIYRQAQALVAVADEVGQRMAARTGRRRPLFVVPNACDTDLFHPDLSGTWFRDANGLNGKILAVHTGTMGRVNGLDDILDAAKLLDDQKDLRIVLIGSGNERERLRRRVLEEGIDNVIILDAVSKIQIAQVLATADIGLMTVAPIPILELNCANKFFDYLASGLPIILNYGGWQARILDQHQCGLAAAQRDLAGFANSIRRLVDDPSLRAQMAGNARRLAEGALSRQAVIQPLLDYLKAQERAHGTR